MSLQGERYSWPAALSQFYEQGLERITAIPGVKSAAVVNGVPIERGLNLNVKLLDIPGELDDNLIDWRYATPGYFKTMGIPLAAGRLFDARDGAGAPHVAVVNEQFTRKYFKDANPIGQRIRVYEQDGPIQIVGVARDVRDGGLVGEIPALMYVPVAQTHEAALRTTHGYFQVSWVVRADNPGPELIRQIREQVRTLDPRQPFSTFRTMDEVKTSHIQAERFQMTLLALFAGIGLLLATAGIYGLISYSVAQRTRELGIRIALGAGRGRILRSIVHQGALLGLCGVGLGVLAALAATRTLQGFLFGVTTLDVKTFVAVGALLILVAVVASLVPALRAVRLNPASALRE
jgi:predicted permease